MTHEEQQAIHEALRKKGIRYTPTSEQFSIYRWIRFGSGNLVIRAVAGAGKTTVLLGCAALLPANVTASFIAFSNTIVNELKTRLAGTPVRPTTIHSAGRTTLCKRIAYPKVDNLKHRKIAEILMKDNAYYANIPDLHPYTMAIWKLCEKARLTLTDYTNPEELIMLADRFNIDLPKITVRRGREEIEKIDERIFELVRRTLVMGAVKARDEAVIDFTDMIWLPYHWHIEPDPSDWLFIDECQDLSNLARAFIAMMLTPDTRAVAVGDPRQAIMEFAGAASDSFDQVKLVLNAQELPLMDCFRCGYEFIKLANVYVPEIRAAKGAIPGEIIYQTEDQLTTIAQRGDLIVCRRTAPLIENCIKLIGSGIPARVRGRDVATSLIELLNKIGKVRGFKPLQFLKFMEEYQRATSEKLAQKEDSEEQIQALGDKCAALEAIYLRHLPPTIKAFEDSISALFADEADNPPIWLSSIHRAKGLEADRVMILHYDALPMKFKKQSVEQVLQENNITYVALTRAKKVLILIVDKLPAPKAPEVIIVERVAPLQLPAQMPLLLPANVPDKI